MYNIIYNKAYFLGVNFCIMIVTMATSHLMTGRYISVFGLDSLKFTLSFGEFFSPNMILPDILKGQKVRVVQTVLPIFCNLSFF